MKKRALLLFFAAVIFVFTGCGIPFQKKLDMYLQAQQFKEADALIELEKKDNKEGIYSGKNSLLYFFDKGAVLQMMKDYSGSTAALQKADEKIDALYTKSLVDETFSLLSDENSIEYRGEDFEQVTVSVLKLLNFMYASDFDGARVESKGINHKLNRFTDEYGEKCIYTEDAFARWLSGYTYEALGEMNDAYIDYKKSLQTYEKYFNVYGLPVPEFVKGDLLRAAEALKYNDEIAEYEAAWGGKPDYTGYKDMKSKADVLVVIYDGMSPVKYDSNTYPKYSSRGNAITHAVAEVGGKQFSSAAAEELSVIAAHNLDNRIGLIMGKKIASSAVKGLFKAFTGVDLGKGKADIRSWRTIPSRFDIIRMAIEPGKKTIKVVLFGVNGLQRTEKFTLDLKPGSKKVLPIYAWTAAIGPKVVEEKKK